MLLISARLLGLRRLREATNIPFNFSNWCPGRCLCDLQVSFWIWTQGVNLASEELLQSVRGARGSRRRGSAHAPRRLLYQDGLGVGVRGGGHLGKAGVAARADPAGAGLPDLKVTVSE